MCTFVRYMQLWEEIEGIADSVKGKGLGGEFV